MKNVALLTSNQPRHKAFISKFYDTYKPKLVVVEEKESSSFLDRENIYFENFINKELFKKDNFFTHVPKGGINSEAVKNKIIEKKIDIAFVFGTSIIKKELFNSVNRFCVNIHTGLVQKYRGVDSNFWALYDEKPEAIGVTIHRVDAGIDTGEVLMQCRPVLDMTDDYETIFFKSCHSGFQILCDNISDVIEDNIVLKEMKNRGKLYKIKDMNNHVNKVVAKKTTKILSRYLENKSFYNNKIELFNRRISKDGIYY